MANISNTKIGPTGQTKQPKSIGNIHFGPNGKTKGK